MTNKDRNDAYNKFLDTWGYDAQALMCIEEMSELTKALCKYNRKRNSNADLTPIIDNIKEEIADVLNCTEQMQMIFGRSEINKIRTMKLDRTLKMLDNEINE